MSDIARVYASASAPGLISGTAASSAAGAGVPEKPGAEKAAVRPAGKELALGGQDLAK